MCFFVQTNHTRKELLFLMFKEINLRNHSSLHKLFYSLAELMGGDNVNYKEDYLNTMTDLKHAVYNDVVGMLFSTVELRHAQIMLTYNSIDNSSTAFGFSVSWQEHNKDGHQEHSDHFIAY